jgi:hypothetical protein
LRYFITGNAHILLMDIYPPLTTKLSNMLLNLVSGILLTHQHGGVAATSPSGGYNTHKQNRPATSVSPRLGFG